MPNCASNSACSSRRSSRGSAVSAGNYVIGGYASSYGGSAHGSTHGSGYASRRSSGGGVGSRRESTSYFVNPCDPHNTGSPTISESPGATGGGAAAATSNLLQSLGSGVVGAAAQSLSNISITSPRYRKPFLSRSNFPL